MQAGRLGFRLHSCVLFGKTLTGESAKFYSPEHKQHFEAKDIELKVAKDPDSPGKLFLSLNEQNILDWFRQKYQEIKQTVRPHITPIPQNKREDKEYKLLAKPELNKGKVLRDNHGWSADIC